jgi:hypothetical protein
VEVSEFQYGRAGEWDVGPVLHTHYVLATDDANAAMSVALDLGLVGWAYEDVSHQECTEVHGLDNSDSASQAAENRATHMLFVTEVR